MESIYIFGGGGTAKEVVYFVKKLSDYEQVYLVVPESEKRKINWHENVISDREFYEIVENDKNRVFKVAVAISSVEPKVNVVRRLLNYKNITFPNLIFSQIDLADVKIGVGNIIYPNVSISVGVEIGNWNIINMNVRIPHDVKIGDFCAVEIASVLGGNVKIEDGVTIASNSTILPGVRIGEYSTVAIGSAVFEDVVAYSTVMGNPAKVVFRKKVKK